MLCTIGGKPARLSNGKYALADYLFDYLGEIELWIAFEDGAASCKVGSATLNFSHADGVYTCTKTTTISLTRNTAKQHNILYFSPDNRQYIVQAAITYGNTYHACYDSDVVGYFQYQHGNVVGDTYETATADGSYTTDGKYRNEATLGTSYRFGRGIEFFAGSAFYEGANIVFFKRQLTDKEVNVMRKVHGMSNRPDSFKPISASYVPKLSGINPLGSGLYPTTYFTPDDPWYPDNATQFVDTQPYFPVEQGAFSPVMPSDDSTYDSVHIVNLDEAFEVGDRMPILSYPVPFVSGQTIFKPVYASDNPSVADVCGDVLICKAAGAANITVTAGNVTDTAHITVAEAPQVADNPYHVPAEHFSATDWEANQDAIFAAIDHAKANGYNRVVYPQIDIHVRVHENLGASDRSDVTAPFNVGYYLPSNMRIEFPKGSRLWFHKSECDTSWEQSRNGTTKRGYTFFRFKGCERTHVYVHTLIGQRYDFRQADGTYSDSSYDYSEQVKLCASEGLTIDKDGTIHRGANYRCSIEIERSADVIGFHVSLGGGWDYWGQRNIVPAQYKEGVTPALETLLYWDDGTPKDGRRITELHYNDFEQGTYADDGTPVEDAHWIRSKRMIWFHDLLPLYSRYSFGRVHTDSAPHSGRLNKIIWLDDNENVVEVRYISQFLEYDRPETATHFLIACATPNVPTADVTGGQGDIMWARLSVGCSDKFWRWRCGHNASNESGVLSLTGYIEGMHIHDSCIPAKGKLNDWSIDFEDGWYSMQNNYAENCYTRQFVNHGTNLTCNNCFFESFETASYAARSTLINCYAKSLYNATFIALEKETQTMIDCNLDAKCYQMIEESGISDRILLIDCAEPEAASYDILKTDIRRNNA